MNLQCVLNKESAIWKDADVKTLLRGDQLKYIDMERMSVGAIVMKTRYWQKLQKIANASCASMSSQAKNCRGRKCAKLKNKK